MEAKTELTPMSQQGVAAAILERSRQNAAQNQGKDQQPTDDNPLVTGEEEPAQSEGEEPTGLIQDSAESQEETSTEDGEQPEQDPLQEYVDSLDPAQRKELASKLGGRLGKDLGDLRAENRELKTTLQAELEKREGLTAATTESNPYEHLKTLDEVKQTYSDAEQMINQGELALMKHGAADESAEIMDWGDQKLTKAEVAEAVQAAKAARDKHLIARWDELKAVEQVSQQREAFDAQANEKFAWLADENDPVAGQVKVALERAENQIRKGIVPPDIKIIMAAAAEHMLRGETAKPKATKPKPKVPLSPSGAAAQAGGPQSTVNKRVKEAQTAFRESGSQQDLARLLLARRQPS